MCQSGTLLTGGEGEGWWKGNVFLFMYLRFKEKFPAHNCTQEVSAVFSEKGLLVEWSHLLFTWNSLVWVSCPNIIINGVLILSQVFQFAHKLYGHFSYIRKKLRWEWYVAGKVKLVPPNQRAQKDLNT